MFDQNDQNQVQNITPVASVATTGFDGAPVLDPAAPMVDPNVGSSNAAVFNTTPYTDASGGATVNTSYVSAPVVDSPAQNAPIATDPAVDITTPSAENVASPSAPEPVVTPPNTADIVQPAISTPTDTMSEDNGLLAIKQNALQNLSPLLSQLEQSPEEKFRTTMMMIQASDDQSLLQAAYDAANSIADDKVKAQALLDVVNEINYFTQSKTSSPQN
ncbi:hypothetical protein KDA11_02540 [Candidatus Saccharibacteria bacterium]|nr:hypothetical protein [Candidatus Saccharibacteria bacterium]